MQIAPMEKPRLVGTPLSHFTRKIRILFAELGVDFDFVRAPGVLRPTADDYGDNPLLRVPALHHRGETLIESDHIARYVVATWDPGDRLGVRSERIADLNRLAVTSGIMANEVTLILAKRGGVAELDAVAYFRKLRSAIDGGLAWLDAHIDPDDDGFDYRDVALVCMWQHVAYYALVPDLARHARLAARVARLAVRPSVAATTPEVSLVEAHAAGWTPG
jgi:glutathione S-transferase